MTVPKAVTKLQDVLKAKPFALKDVTKLMVDDSFREEIVHDDAVWSALDAICDFLDTNSSERCGEHGDVFTEILSFLTNRAKASEFLLALSDRIARVKNDEAWSFLLLPLSLAVKKFISNRPVSETVEDALFTAASYVKFLPRKFDETCDVSEVSDICCRNVVVFVEQFFTEEIKNDSELAMYNTATCLMLAASPLCSVLPKGGMNNLEWKRAVSALCSVAVSSSPYSILLDLTDPCYRQDMFLGRYFFNNANTRWSHLRAGLCCLLASDNPTFRLPEILDPRFRFYICSYLIADLLTEMTDTPNPDIDMPANGFACSVACQLITSLSVSVPPNSFLSDCLTSMPSFTLLVRRLFTNLTGSQSSFIVDTEAAGELVKAIDVLMSRFDGPGRWQMMWLWINQVPADNHPAGPVRAVVIDKFRSILAASVNSGGDSSLPEKIAKMLPMMLTLVLAKENVHESQPGLLRVDAALSTLNLLNYLFLLPAEKKLINEQTCKTLSAWLEYELRPAVFATRNFLTNKSSADDSSKTGSNMNPWTYFSGQLLSRLDLVEFTLARVEQTLQMRQSKILK